MGRKYAKNKSRIPCENCKKEIVYGTTFALKIMEFNKLKKILETHYVCSWYCGEELCKLKQRLREVV